VTLIARARQSKRSAALVLLAALVLAALLVGTHAFTGASHAKKFEIVVKVDATSRYGNILVVPHGTTLYTYKLDRKDRSNCVTFCSKVWPPLVVEPGVVPVGHGVSGLGTIPRADGQRQVTYEGMPLYTYVYDHAPGAVNGEGGWWSVVRVS
jgi:predicted lipoprotein with Yx(FWY)xxD motif